MAYAGEGHVSLFLTFANKLSRLLAALMLLPPRHGAAASAASAALKICCAHLQNRRDAQDPKHVDVVAPLPHDLSTERSIGRRHSEKTAALVTSIGAAWLS